MSEKLSVVGITGFAGVGKSTLARYLSSSHRYTELALADPLKAAAKCLGWDGKKDEKGRQFLQRLGTEAIRGTFGDGFWVELLIDRVKSEETVLHSSECVKSLHCRSLYGTLKTRWEKETQTYYDDCCLGEQRIVIPDVRFVNEAGKLHEAFGSDFSLIRVIRSGIGPYNTHASEMEQRDIRVDFEVINSEGYLNDMYVSMNQFLYRRGHLGTIPT